MRIAFFDDRFDQVYGAQENVLLLAELARRSGHDPLFLTTEEGPLASEARRRNLTVDVVPAPPSLRRFEGTSFEGGAGAIARLVVDLVRYNVVLGRVVREHDADVVVSAAVRPTALLLGTRLINRAPIFLYAQNSIPRGSLAVVAGLASRKICLIGDGARSTFPGWFQRRFASRFADLPSGRDIARYASTPLRSVSGNPAPVEVVTVSSLTERKGLHLLIDAAAEVVLQGRPLRLTVVGGTTGPLSAAYLAELRDQVDRLGVDVEFADWQDDVAPFLAAADIFAIASDNEGLPGVLIEAMASGLPCVTTRAGSAGDLVEDAGAGYAVDIGDVDALAEALLTLADDPQLRIDAGRRGYHYVQSRHNLEAFQRRFEAVLSAVAGSRGVRDR